MATLLASEERREFPGIGNASRTDVEKASFAFRKVSAWEGPHDISLGFPESAEYKGTMMEAMPGRKR